MRGAVLSQCHDQYRWNRLTEVLLTSSEDLVIIHLEIW
jgi:hypothetical protein